MKSRMAVFVRRVWSPAWRPALLAGALLFAVYMLTLQRQINGSSAEYTLDVGEMQVALNLWGTLHTTGYPLFILLGAPIVAALKLLGVNPATAASSVSMIWSFAAFTVIYDLLRRRTGRPWLAGALVLVLGLMESVWLHSVVAEVYSLFLLFVSLITWLVLADDDAVWTRRRWLVLAALLGFGSAHHRAVAYLVPGLAVYLWPRFWRARREMPLTLLLGALVALAGYLPYLYMPLYARLGGVWNYEDPGTWYGFWSLFFGKEAGLLWYLPRNLGTLGTNVAYILWVMSRQFTVIGLAASMASLLGLFFIRDYPRRVAVLLAVWTATYAGFAFVFPRVVLAEAFLMPAYLALLIAAGEAASRLLWRREAFVWAGAGLLVGVIAMQAWESGPLIHALTRDPTGVEYVAHIVTLEPDEDGRQTVLVVPWGPRYTAMAYGLYVTHAYGGFEPVDHRGQFDRILARGDRLVTTPETFYTLPPDWFATYIEQDVTLRAAGPGFVEIDTELMTDADVPLGKPVQLDNGVTLLSWEIESEDEGSYHLTLYWQADDPPDENYSVYVHLVDGGTDKMLDQADSYAPVSGWYPVMAWRPGEVVRDEYRVTALQDYDGPLMLRVGMYRQLDDGTFDNYDAFSQPLR